MTSTSSRAWRITALLAAAALVFAGCGDNTDDQATGGSDTTSGEGGDCPEGAAIGFFGALTGSDAALGINEINGVKVALAQYEEETGCSIELKDYDSQGDPAQAPALAQQAVQDEKVLALVGPAFSGESKQANPIFDEAGLPIITPSATNPDLSKNGWKIFHRAVANDNAQGPAAAKYILGKDAKKVAVIDDASEYGKGLADIVRTELKDGGATVSVSESIDPKASNYGSTVNKVKAADVDAIFYGGYYESAGRLMKQLRDSNVDAMFVSGDGSLDAKFLESSGSQGNGAILLAPGAYTSSDESFSSAYKEINGTEPGLYSGEAYDAANHILEAIKAGNTTREDINEYISENEYKGLLKTYSYDDTGELEGGGVIIVHEVKDGAITLVGPVE